MTGSLTQRAITHPSTAFHMARTIKNRCVVRMGPVIWFWHPQSYGDAAFGHRDSVPVAHLESSVDSGEGVVDSGETHPDGRGGRGRPAWNRQLGQEIGDVR